MSKETQTKELPIDIVKLLNSKETTEEIAAICFLNGLDENEETEKATYQIIRVLLGESPPELLSDELTDKEGIPLELSKNIAEDINVQILSQVKSGLRKLYQVPLKKRKAEQLKKPPKKENYKKDSYREAI